MSSLRSRVKSHSLGSLRMSLTHPVPIRLRAAGPPTIAALLTGDSDLVCRPPLIGRH